MATGATMAAAAVTDAMATGATDVTDVTAAATAPPHGAVAMGHRGRLSTVDPWTSRWSGNGQTRATGRRRWGNRGRGRRTGLAHRTPTAAFRTAAGLETVGTMDRCP